jgi:hypothetical protein
LKNGADAATEGFVHGLYFLHFRPNTALHDSCSFLLAQKKTHFLYLALGTMENNSLFALDFLEQFRELFLESCTCKMHRACYVTIQIPFSIPSKHHSPLIIRLPNSSKPSDCMTFLQLEEAQESSSHKT